MCLLSQAPRLSDFSSLLRTFPGVAAQLSLSDELLYFRRVLISERRESHGMFTTQFSEGFLAELEVRDVGSSFYTGSGHNPSATPMPGSRRSVAEPRAACDGSNKSGASLA